MRRFLTRLPLRKAAERYGYDTTYLETVLRAAPSAFFTLARIAHATARPKAVPLDAWHTAKLCALAEDCGACVQLVADMAHDSGMGPGQIEAVLVADTLCASSIDDVRGLMP